MRKTPNTDAPVKPGKYRHFKGGRYEVLFTATHSETLEQMVVYRSLAGGDVWVRPASMWNETVTRDGKTFRRFTPIDETDGSGGSDSETGNSSR